MYLLCGILYILFLFNLAYCFIDTKKKLKKIRKYNHFIDESESESELELVIDSKNN